MYWSRSCDGGFSWTRPEAVHIAAANAPSAIRRMPSTGELLMVWNQASRQEIVTAAHRTRLSCAISRDEGETWENYKSLESLDDVTRVTRRVDLFHPASSTEKTQNEHMWGYIQPEESWVNIPEGYSVLRETFVNAACATDGINPPYG